MGVPFARSVTLRRYPTGSTGSDGRWSKGTPTDSTISANIQPLRGHHRQQLPEGDRHRDGIRYSTKTVVYTADQYTQRSADELVIDGVTYEVMTAESWTGVLPHTEGLALRTAEAPA